MADALTIASLSMSNDMVRMAAVSHNLANATTPGYRREIVYSRPFQDVLASAAGGTTLAVPLPDPRVVIDAQRGTLRATGAPLDVALQDDDGWFELAGPDGPVYTRQGDFQLDGRGRLVSHGGLPVAGTGGDILLQGNGAVRIDDQGRVFEDGRPAGQLRIVRFAHQSALEPLGEGLVRPTGEAGTLAADPRVRQGFLENANVININEMVRMIETMRHFETNQKLIQSYDDSLGRAIRTLGEF